jgi:phenylpyruvate tautomerase PptA (4-oxalocrotonate tautomerase family)
MLETIGLGDELASWERVRGLRAHGGGLTPEVVRSYAGSVLPAEVAFDDEEDLAAGVQRIARVMVRHLRLPEPDARIAVSFRSMPEAAWVALAEGPRYEVELHPRFDGHRRDIGAVLAHEVTHILLHREGLSLPDTEADEVLTDTAAVYLGAGWLLLDAFRQDALTSQKLGYLTPEEYGYVLAKRAAVFGEDPRVWFTSPQAYQAYAKGLRLAEREAAQPPLASAGWAARQRYAAHRAVEHHPCRPVRPAARLEPVRSARLPETVAGAQRQAPLGRVLIQHNVLREVQLTSLWRINPAEELRNLLDLPAGQIIYGRTALIYCNGEPAVELLEIVTPD